MAEQLRCKPGDLAVIVPGGPGAIFHAEDHPYIGAFVTCLRYIGDFRQPRYYRNADGTLTIEVHFVARAWQVSAPIFIGVGLVSDDCLRPIRGDRCDEDRQEQRERDAPVAV